MRDEKRAAREDEILDAALAVLREKGYREATVLAVARQAKASKETIYAWFGDKAGLYAALIRRNARRLQSALDEAEARNAPLEETLRAFGAALIRLLAGDSAVAINRAAIGETARDDTLAITLAREGREATLPRLAAAFDRGAADGTLHIPDRNAALSDFLGLLLGDLQIRRLLGTAPAPDAAEVDRRAAEAARKFLILYGA